jgi:hypothetical protein
MSKRKSGLIYIAAFFLILGVASFIMPLIRGEIGLFSLFGVYALYAKIACLGIGVIILVIGLVRYFRGPKPDAAAPTDTTAKKE